MPHTALPLRSQDLLKSDLQTLEMPVAARVMVEGRNSPAAECPLGEGWDHLQSSWGMGRTLGCFQGSTLFSAGALISLGPCHTQASVYLPSRHKDWQGHE